MDNRGRARMCSRAKMYSYTKICCSANFRGRASMHERGRTKFRGCEAWSDRGHISFNKCTVLLKI